MLDWEGALASGDPMQDLAWPALRMWRFRNETAEIGGFAGRAPFVAGYEAAGGTFDEDRFEWWKVEGTLRWAVGLAGQTMAFLDGRVPSIVMAASGRRVSELEWDLLMLIRPELTRVSVAGEGGAELVHRDAACRLDAGSWPALGVAGRPSAARVPPPG